MSKFKVGDKVRRTEPGDGFVYPDGEYVVSEVLDDGWLHVKGTNCSYGEAFFELVESTPATGEPVYAGHHSDGSSIQKHSAGPLYPYVIVYRDKKGGPDSFGKYDVGVIGPKHEGTIWCKDFNHAVALAEHLKGSTT